MRYLISLLSFSLSFGSMAAVKKENSQPAGGTARVDEKNIDELKTINASTVRTPQKIDYNDHTYSGQNGHMYSKEDDQQRMEEAHQYLEKQKTREESEKGA